jgi:tetratricopeptide (TPR) repeat protein
MACLGCQSFQPLKQATREHVGIARQWTRGGIEALQSGRVGHAKSCFTRAAAHDPGDQLAHANLARAVIQDGNAPQAIDHMRRAVELSNNDPRLIVELGEMYLQAGQWLPAKRQAEQALAINHRFAPAWALQARTSLAKGELESALAEFQKAAGFDPELLDVQLAIAETYQSLNQPLRSLSAIEQLLSRYPPSQQPESALIAKSVALIELKKFSPAIEMMRAASQREGASSEIYFRLGQAQLLAGQVSQARLTLSRAQRVFPNKPEFGSLLSQLQSAEQRVARVDLNVTGG